MKVKRYKIKKNIKEKDLIKAGAIQTDNGLAFIKYVEVRNSEIRIDITFPEEVYKWNDVDNVMVTNSDADQPYSPYYEFRDSGKDVSGSAAIEKFVTEYNAYMDSLPFLKHG